MGFYTPPNMDAIGLAQIKVLEAVQGHEDRALRVEFRHAGVALPDNRFIQPETEDAALVARWKASQSFHHSLGAAHGGILDEFRRRLSDDAVPGGGS